MRDCGVPHLPNAPLTSTLPPTDGRQIGSGHLSPIWRNVHSEDMKRTQGKCEENVIKNATGSPNK